MATEVGLRAIGGVAVLLAVGVHALAAEEPTWSGRIASIVHQRCAECHHAGGPAPMSLLEYDEVRPWAKSLAREVEAATMPPWHA